MNKTILDLNINNYSIEELEHFFQLKNNYNIDELIQNENNIREKLISSGYISKKYKSSFYNFLEKAKTKIINNKFPIVKPTTIQNNNEYNNKKRILNEETHTFKDFDNVPPSLEPPIDRSYQIINKNEYTGNINPLNKKTIIKQINIDTIFFNMDSKTNEYTYYLSTPLQNVINMKVSSFELFYVWYIFSNKSNNNFFYITLYNAVDKNGNFYESNTNTGYSQYYTNTVMQKVIIEEGSYTLEELVDYFNNYFSSSNNGLELIKCFYIKSSSKIGFRALSTYDNSSIGSPYDYTNIRYNEQFFFNINFDIDNNNEFEKINNILGYKNVNYDVKYEDVYNDLYTNIIYNYSCLSDYQYNNKPNTYLFLDIDDYHTNFISNYITSNINNNNYIGNNIIAKINIDNNNKNVISYMDVNILKNREYFGPIKLDKFKFRILNRYGTPFDFKCNYSFLLEITQLY